MLARHSLEMRESALEPRPPKGLNTLTATLTGLLLLPAGLQQKQLLQPAPPSSSLPPLLPLPLPL